MTRAAPKFAHRVPFSDNPRIASLQRLEIALGIVPTLSMRLEALWFVDGPRHASVSDLRDHLHLSTSGAHRLVQHMSTGYRDGLGRDQPGAHVLEVEMWDGRSRMVPTEKGHTILAAMRAASAAAEAPAPSRPAEADAAAADDAVVSMTAAAQAVILALTARCGGPSYSDVRYEWENPDWHSKSGELAALLILSPEGRIVELEVYRDMPDLAEFVYLFQDIPELVVCQRGDDDASDPKDVMVLSAAEIDAIVEGHGLRIRGPR